MVRTWADDEDFKNKITHDPRKFAEALFKAMANNADKISQEEINSETLPMGVILSFF